MPQLTVKLVAALALAGVSLGDVLPATAQGPEVGEVTISDARPEPITEAESLPTPGDGTEDPLQPTPDFGAGYPVGYPGAGYPGAGDPGAGDPNLPPGARLIQGSPGWYGYERQGPWQRPIRRPLYRVPVQYARYWPTSYYTGISGPPLVAQPLPMVYQPTDTTQLGFYHQRVPTWQPNPNMLPPAPWPPHWHYTIPTRFGVYQYPYDLINPNGGDYAAGASYGGAGGPIDYSGSSGVIYGSPVMDSEAINQPEPSTSQDGESSASEIPLAPAPTPGN